MVIKKTHIFSVILVLAIGLFAAFYYVHTRMPPQIINSFAGQAVAPEISSFSEYYRAKVLAVDEEGQEYEGISPVQTIKIRFLTGTAKDKELEIDNQDPIGTTAEQKIKEGDVVIVGKLQNNAQQDQGPPYLIIDKYRLPAVGLIVGLFFILALVFGRIRGAMSIGGLAFSIFILAFFIVPGIMGGKDPVVVSLIGSALIIMVSIFLAHGFNERSAIATISTFIAIGLAGTMSYYFVHMSKLFGLGSESAFYLQSGLAGSLNLRGLLLAGIIIGTLGILDDVTTTQTAAVDEIFKANKKMSFKELYAKAASVGREHIASLVNTLVLAYAGASLPLFLLITTSTSQPLWIVLNSEFVAEELVRTLVGSAALILAVPISTLLAAYYYKKNAPAS
jgi:uncharacterized membrane protein